MIDLGTVRPGSTIRIPFSSFDKDDGSSITMTNFSAADLLVYKDGSTTERASTNGYTATTDFDSKTGKHLAIIDLADNTTSGFWNAGSEYLVAIDAVTVDTVTTGGWIARFRIGYPGALLDTTIATLSTQTSFTLTTGPAEDDALNGRAVIIHDIASAVQLGWGIISDYTGASKTVTLAAGVTFTAAAGDNISIMDPMPMQPATAGRNPVVDANGLVDANTVKLGPSGSGTAQTARDVGGALPAAAAGGAGGLWILGSNNTAAITIGAITTGAIACTTITASGAVAFQSTFAVTTSTSLGALSCTTLTASGAVAFQSTFAVTTSTSLAALSASTVTFSGAVAFQSTFAVTTSTNLAALSCSTLTTSGTATLNALTVSNATTLTGAVSATNASNDIRGILLQATQSGVTIPTVTTVTNQLTAAQIATGVWQDTTAGDFTVASSIGKSLYTAGVVPGGSGGLFIAGTNAATTITTALTTTFTGNLTGSVASVTNAVTITAPLKKNTAYTGYTFLMTDSTNHAPATGLTVSVTRSIDGAAFAAGTLGSVTEISNGLYKVDFGAGDLNGDLIVLRATATGADATIERIITHT